MTKWLNLMVDDTIEQIESGNRDDGLDLPLDAHQAARQAMPKAYFTEAYMRELLVEWLDRFVERSGENPDWRQFAQMSLCDFVAELAKEEMGPRYQQLFSSRYGQGPPSQAG